MSFTAYVTEHILKPANLTDTYYWLGGQGMEPQGIRKNVVSIPGYRTTFTDSTGSAHKDPYFMMLSPVCCFHDITKALLGCWALQQPH